MSNYFVPEFLLRKAYEFKDQFSTKEAYMILTSFSRRHFDSPLQFNLYQNLIDLILQNMDKISINELSYLLYTMLDLFCRADVNYYNDKLIEKSIDCAISRKVNFIGVGKILKCCHKVVS